MHVGDSIVCHHTLASCAVYLIYAPFLEKKKGVSISDSQAGPAIGWQSHIRFCGRQPDWYLWEIILILNAQHYTGTLSAKK